MSKEFTPIAIFVYNRYDKFIATLQSLYENIENDIPIFFFIDGPKNSKDKIIIENIFNTISNNDYFNNKRIFKNKKNLGLKQNIINGVNKVFLDYDKIIVLEDDILINKHFYQFMNTNLNNRFFKDQIGSVTGYSFVDKKLTNYDYDIYFSYRHSSWGWGTWKDIWHNIEFDKLKKENFKIIKKELDKAGTDIYRMLVKDKNDKMNSWSIYFDYYCIKNKLLCLVPIKSLVKNIGFDIDGTNTKKKSDENITYDPSFKPKIYPQTIIINKNIIKNIKSRYSRSLKKLILKILCL